MDSESDNQSTKPTENTLLYLALGICYSGLFIMLVAVAAVLAAATFGNKMFNADFSYLLAVSFYLGLVVAALIGVMLNYSEPEERKVPAVIRRDERRR
jgi:cytosine/uracil/thiamine/allantoin permease